MAAAACALVLVGALGVVQSLLGVTGASAQIGGGTDANGWATGDGGAVIVEHGATAGGGTSGPGGGGRPQRCVHYLQDSSTGGIAAGAEVSIAQIRAEAVADTLVWRVCTWLDTAERQLPQLVVVSPSPARVARTAAERAAAELVLPLPLPHTNPTDRTLVNLPTWLWTDRPGAIQRSAAAGGVTATVGAQVVRTAWRTGDGVTLDCNGPGVAYDVTRPAEHQRSACTHTYSTMSGRLDASVTQVWHLVWTATNGESGDLGEVSRATAFTIDVVELDTVLRTR